MARGNGDGRAATKNIGRMERIGSTLVGATLAAIGLRHRGWGALVGAGGAALALRGVTGHCPVRYRLTDRERVLARKSVTVLRSAREVYVRWRDLERLPEFLLHVTRITMRPDGTSHWELVTPSGALEWRTEIVEDIPEKRIAWRSLTGCQLEHDGSVNFVAAPGDKGTEVHVTLRYKAPSGVATSMLRPIALRLTSEQFDAELRRMKQLLETGEVATGARRRQDRTTEESRGVAQPSEPGPAKVVAS